MSLTLVLALSACGGDDPVVVNHPPTIYGVVEAKTINVGEAYDPLLGVYALDDEDGDVSADLEVAGTYDIAAQGSYSIVVSVEDSEGEQVQKTISLTVNDPASTNETPTFAGPTRYLHVIGDDFDAALLGVTASDAEDGDLTASIIINDDGVQATVKGYYFVFYTVTDSLGVQSSFVVTVSAIVAGANPRDGRAGADDTLIVGTSEFNGNFISGFGSSAYDNYVISLTSGAGMVSGTPGGDFVINDSAVASYTAIYENAAAGPDTILGTLDDVFVDDADKGNLTYEFTIKEGMKFSDDTPITASDYVFAAKLLSSAVYVNAGGSGASFYELVGYPEWNAGCYFTSATAVDDADTTDVDERCDTTHNYTTTPLDFAGVELVSEFVYSLTVAEENLPYFYQLTLVMNTPLPEDAYTNDGAYGFLTATEIDALSATAVHLGGYVKDTFLNSPTISSGPYTFVEYEPGQYVQFVKNDNFVGDYDGAKASIENLIIRVVPNATDIEHILNGEIDILPGVVEGDKIDLARETDFIDPITFYRVGYGMLAFATDFGPVQDYRVRQAIAYLIDRTTFVEAFLGGWGETVQGPYGLGQWMYQDTTIFDDGKIINYTVDVAEAATLLTAAGWGFQSDGTTAYVQEAGAVRYNAAGEMLEINWLGTISGYSDLLGPIMILGFEQAGIKLNATQSDFGTLLDNYYYAYELADEDRQYHMFNLANTFSAAFDPYWSYHTDQLGTWQNSNQISDKPATPLAALDTNVVYNVYASDGTTVAATHTGELTIDELTVLMRELEPTQKAEFQLYWDMFIVRMNKLVPNIPLYSNEYHHFSNTDIKGFSATAFWDWTDSINTMTIGAAQ